MKQITFAILFLAFLLSGCRTEQKSTVVRFATFNTALYRSEAGQLHKDLEKGNYLYDDKDNPASLSRTSSFVIMGDMNADPQAGDSYRNAINQLLEHPRIHPETATGNLVPSSEGSKIWHEQNPNGSHPAHKTAVFNLRVDYVLPSSDLQPLKSGVFWPAPSDSLSYLTTGREGSDHRMVWVDVAW